MDLPGRLGPGDGRYLIRPDGEPDADPDVLVLSTLGAPGPSPRLRRGRARDAEGPSSPPPLPLSRVTMIRPRPFADAEAADAWLEQVSAERELGAALATEAAGRLNRALHAHRTAAGDPYLADVSAARAVAIRFGFGTGDDVADGRWQRAREMPESERRGLLTRDYEAMRPQERIAAVLAGRERVGPHEELILRARGDLDAGRAATAALGLHAGLEALLASHQAPPTAAGEALLKRLAEGESIAAQARRRVLAGSSDSDLDLRSLEVALKAAEVAMRQRALG